MYTGNGVTTEFPLPDGVDGINVWLTPPNGKSIRMETGTAYTITGGAVRFIIPPPDGWTVSFIDLLGTETMKDGYVVVYANGTMKIVQDDPAELLEQARATLDAAKTEREALKSFIDARGAEIKALANAAKAELESRLLNYGARAEEAIKAAAGAARLDAEKQVGSVIDELRAGQKNVIAAKNEVLTASEAVKNAARTAADEAAARTALSINDVCAEALEAWRRFQALKPELEALAETAKNAAAAAGFEVRRDMTVQCGVLLEEIRGIRGRLERDVIREAEREERRRNEAVKEMQRLRDEAGISMRKMSQAEARALVIAERASASEDRARDYSERTMTYENARLAREARARKAVHNS